MSNKQLSLWEDQRLRLADSLELSIASLNAYGENYRHWAIAYSGGKDSSALVSFVVWAVQSGRVKAPESLTVLYADTRQELPPLQATAMDLLNVVRSDGFSGKVVLPGLDDRFYVYMFGRGVPPPKNRFRWCTPQLKVEPMQAALAHLRETSGEKLLMLTGVRLGESAARDQRIAVSCSKDAGECGQGWFQTATDTAVADTLAPLLHWRLCHIFDWLYGFTPRGISNPYQKIVGNIAVVYGEDEVRTGCVGCNLASKDTALERLIRDPEWSHLHPLKELKPLWAELTKAKNRKRKDGTERRKDGKVPENVQRLGPLTMEARSYGLDRVLEIQARAQVDLINDEEEARIRELWQLNTWPEGWSGDEINGDVLIDAVRKASDYGLVVQPLLG